MDMVLREELDKFVTVYLDDILIFSRTEQEHEQHLRWVLSKLREHHLHAKLKKSPFGLNRLNYLGHILHDSTIQMEPAKTAAIDNWPTPTSRKELQTFLGLANYIAKLVHHFVTLAAPLHQLLCKNVAWAWTAQHD